MSGFSSGCLVADRVLREFPRHRVKISAWYGAMTKLVVDINTIAGKATTGGRDVRAGFCYVRAGAIVYLIEERLVKGDRHAV